EKFNIDKRRGHLSDLIRSGQLKRESALIEIQKEGYEADLLAQDKQFVFKKLGISEVEFEEIMDLDVKSFKDYPNNFKKIGNIKKLVNKLRSKGLYSK
ncbi:MAG TPA: N-acetyl sugar amidotransferase, partial [Balneola sp.]|nr:N-acetyl sugar amidotransferase [Balneola sp.]